MLTSQRESSIGVRVGVGAKVKAGIGVGIEAETGATSKLGFEYGRSGDDVPFPCEVCMDR